MKPGYDYQADTKDAVAAPRRFMIVTEYGRKCLCGHGNWLDKPGSSNGDLKLPGLLPSFCQVGFGVYFWVAVPRLDF